MAEQFQNFFVTKLREACDATATTIYVDTVPAITEGTLVLEYANSTKHEIIHFTGVSGYGLTGCTRGLEGTTAQSHSAGTDVRQNLTAGMIDKIINGVITTENIANSAVTTAKINNGAVTADKIDFTTLNTLPKCVISARSSSNATINGGAIVPLKTQDNKLGSGISLDTETGRFVIGSGISYILAFASWTGSPEASGFRRVHIRKNGSQTEGYAFTTTDVATGYLNGSVAGILISVTEGDIIDLYNRETKMTFWTGTRMSIIGF